MDQFWKITLKTFQNATSGRFLMDWLPQSFAVYVKRQQIDTHLELPTKKQQSNSMPPGNLIAET